MTPLPHLGLPSRRLPWRHRGDNAAWLLWAADASAPAQTAVLDGQTTCTFSELRQRAGSIASLVTTHGVMPGDRVGIFLERSIESAAAYFGVLAAGAVAVNIHEALRSRQVAYQLQHSGAKVLLTQATLLSRLGGAPETTALVLEVPENLPSVGWEPVRRVGRDVAHIIYTSGSTGLPKGVVVSHDNVWAGAWAVTQYLGLRPSDRIAAVLPFSFDYGLNQLLCSLGVTATLVIDRSVVRPQTAARLRHAGVTVLAGVPSLWLQLLETGGFTDSPLPALRIMTNTGGHVPVRAVRRLRAAQPQAQLYLMYGLTEAFRSAYLPPSEVDRRPNSIGIAIPEASILVMRPDGTPCAPGEVGELVHRGPTVTLGYWKDPEATESVFRPLPQAAGRAGEPGERVVYSGDLVRRDEDGFLYYVGRRDQLIKRLGMRVSRDEIADTLYASDEIAEVAVAGEPAGEGKDGDLVAYVVLRPGGSLDRLRAFVRAELPRHMQPDRIEVRSELQRTPSGKYAYPGRVG
jgi:amino acid adenylation domain-containing protein